MTLLFIIGAGITFYMTNDFIPSLIVGVVFIFVGGLFIGMNVQRKNKLLLQSGIYDIDKMKGVEFENYLKLLYQKKGYDVSMTPGSGDFGADLVVKKDGKKSVVQVKRYSKSVGIKAVQEIIPAIRHYNASDAWVITNSTFTSPAVQLAKSNNVRLIDRDMLIQVILDVKRREQKKNV